MLLQPETTDAKHVKFNDILKNLLIKTGIY